MSHGGGESVSGMDPSSIENRQAVGASQGHASLAPGHGSWSSSTGQATVSWNFHQTGSGPIENGAPSSSGYYYDQQKEMSVSADAQDGINTASHASGEANSAQAYAGYDPYGYSMYYGYQQPASDSSSQQVGASQTPGAPYQPPSSFQNTGHYVGPPSYSASYYDAGDHQMAAGYNHSIQTNNWNATNYGSYPQQHYPGYTTSDTNSAQATSTAVGSSLHYQQPYNPWPYYSPSAPVVSGAPGTQNTAATAASVAAFPVQSASIGYPYPNNQPPPPGTTSWNRDSGSSGLPYSQVTKDNTPYNKTGGWEVGAQGFQNTQIHQLPSYFQMPLDSNPPHENYDNQQKTVYPQGPSSQLSSTNQVFENFQPPLQNVMTMDARRVSKIQIPTNPRIASSLALGMPKPDKEGSPTNAAMKPVYISVSVPKLNNKISSHADAEAEAEAVAKGTFPPSLRAYVERTFARCKDDAQRVANQNIMKEMITNASADGTLVTKNWDVEPLFPLPNTSVDMADQSNVQSSLTAPSLPKFKRSPNRRTKSRWEPIAEENVVEKLVSANNNSPKDVSWGHLKGTERTIDSRNYESMPNGWSGVRFLSSQQRTPKIAQRPMKKLRFSNASNVTENGDASSDSDKEQSLTKYYASAIALADSPEERKRREHRSKRFEKGHDNQAEVKHARPKIAGAGNIYTRRASATLLSRSNEDGFSRAVEDIDWDALTVRGTCHEIEKRYLRLTSAPDPATVRPEEILEKALHMVQTSQRNYLYKCDQLKSIRQDLTVQRIQNELTVKVYETHARLALEAGDLPEYNQCQSQLKRLYAEGIKGCHMEFSAYNLLCVILHSNNKRDLLSSMARLSDEAKEDEAVKHALAVRSAVSSGNYILFFRLYKAAPNLNTCLMDLCVEQMRFEAVKSMSKSYRPIVPITYIARVLGFSRGPATEDGQDKFTDGLEECEEWLRAHGAVLTVDNNGELQLDAKVSSSSLYMPDPEDAVAHGDATLAVNDFLTRAS